MLGPSDVGGVCVHAGAGHVTELAAELGLDAPRPRAAPGHAPGLESRLLLLVLLALQVLPVRLGGLTN